MKRWRSFFVGGSRRTRWLVCAVALFAGTFAAATGAAAVASGQAGAEASVIPVNGTSDLEGIACMSATTCLAVGSGHYVLVHDGSNGGAISLPGFAARAVACPTAANCYGVGQLDGEGVVIPFLYGEALTPVFVPVEELYSIACTPGTTACVAVGGGGLYTYGLVVPLTGGDPHDSQSVATLHEFWGVACPTPETCVAVGQTRTGAGGFVTITSGVVGTAHLITRLPLETVACTTATTCWAGADTGEVVPITATALGTPITVAGVSWFSSSTCPTATQCYLVGIRSTSGDVVVPVTAGTVGTAQVVITTTTGARLYGIACLGADTCLSVGTEYIGGHYVGILVTSAVPIPPPTIKAITFSGTGYGLTVKVKGTNFGPWPPEATPITPVSCAAGAPSYDYASGVLSFTDATEGWSAGTPGSCIGVVIASWSSTTVTFRLGEGYVWPLLADGNAYQVSILGTTKTGTASVTSAPAPSISSVVVTGTTGSTSPTLTVKGADLGTRVPPHGPSPTCVADDTSRVFPNDLVFVSDNSRGWTGGEPGDCLGLVVSSWTATKVVLTFGSFYPDLNSMAAGDSITVGLLDATWSGTASATPPPKITALRVTGKPASPVVTVTGKGFGTPPAPDPSTSTSCPTGNYTYAPGQLQFILTGEWTAGETGDCVGLVIKTWTATKVVLSFGADYHYFQPVEAGDAVSIEVKGTTFAATAGA
jgi:hypothetical protein